MLVLVHGPHQTAIALLNQIGEREAAAAITLGDSDHQPQVALGQFSAGLLIEPLAAMNHGHQALHLLAGGAGFQGQVAQLLDEACLALAVGGGAATFADLLFHFRHGGDPAREVFAKTLQQLRARRHLLDELDRLANQALQIPPHAIAAGVGTGPQQGPEDARGRAEHMLQRAYVMGHAGQNLFSTQTQAGDDVNGRDRAEVSRLDALKGFEHAATGSASWPAPPRRKRCACPPGGGPGPAPVRG